jgi:DNA-binding MarR family transcriptional regulator
LINDLLVLGAAGDHLIRQFRRSLKLSRLDLQILLCLGEGAEGSQCGISPSSIARCVVSSESHVINRLELAQGDGLIRRVLRSTGHEFAAATDARRTFYVLTPEGRTLARKVRAGIGVINDVLAVLSSKTAQAGVHSLAQVLAKASSKGVLQDPLELARAINQRVVPAGRHEYEALSLARIERLVRPKPRRARRPSGNPE